MHCDEFEARLNDLLDLRLDPADDRPLAEHADDCRDCRQLLAAYHDCVSTPVDQAIPPVTADLSQRVLDRCRMDLPEVAEPSRGSYLPHLAAAAAIVLVALNLNQAQQRPVARPIARSTPPRLEEHARPNALPPAPSALAIADEPMAEPWSNWNYDAAGIISDVASLLPATGAWNIPAPATPAPEIGRSPVIAEVATGLKPLADSATGAMYFLLDVLPASGAGGGPLLDSPAGVAPVRSTNEAI